jgi:hypothetical protein
MRFNAKKKASQSFGISLGVLLSLAFFSYTMPDCIHYRVACGGGEFIFRYLINIFQILIPAALAIYLVHLSMKYLGDGL